MIIVKYLHALVGVGKYGGSKCFQSFDHKSNNIPLFSRSGRLPFSLSPCFVGIDPFISIKMSECSHNIMSVNINVLYKYILSYILSQ